VCPEALQVSVLEYSERICHEHPFQQMNGRLDEPLLELMNAGAASLSATRSPCGQHYHMIGVHRSADHP